MCLTSVRDESLGAGSAGRRSQADSAWGRAARVGCCHLSGAGTKRGWPCGSLGDEGGRGGDEDCKQRTPRPWARQAHVLSDSVFKEKEKKDLTENGKCQMWCWQNCVSMGP